MSFGGLSDVAETGSSCLQPPQGGKMHCADRVSAKSHGSCQLERADRISANHMLPVSLICMNRVSANRTVPVSIKARIVKT